MNLLAIDAGNSRIKWGLHAAGAWSVRGTVATAQPEGLRGTFSALAAPEAVVIANVAGEEAARRIGEAVAGFAVQPFWVVSRAEQCGVRSSYANPSQLGPDRWAALIGARHLCAGPCAVVNVGTTATVDALSRDGIFLGGFIIPGYTLMRQALAGNTALLELQEGRVAFFPDNTGDAIASGAANAIAGAIERMTRYMSDTGEGDATVFMSGGDAEIVAPLLNEPVQLVDNLVLEGLLCIGASGV